MSSYTPVQWRALITGFALMLLSGLVNGWSIFMEPIEADLGLLRQETSLVFTVSLSVSIGGQMLAGALCRRLPGSHIYRLIAALSLAGFLGAARAGGIWGIYLFYGVFAGLAIGMIYNLVLTGVAAQFGSGVNLVSGILLMGFGVGPLVLGMAAAALLSAAGWRAAFTALAVLYAALLLAASFLIPSRGAGAAGGAAGGGAGVSTRAMLRDGRYWCFFMWCVSLGASALVVTGHSTPIARDIGAGVAAAGLMTGVVAVASGFTRPFFGRMADKLGGGALKGALTLCSLLGSAGVLGGYAAGSMPLLAAGYVLAGAANGGAAVYICDYVKTRYGEARYGMNMAVTNLYMILGSVLGTAAAGGIKTRTGSYTLAFALMLGFSALGALFAALHGKDRDIKEAARD